MSAYLADTYDFPYLAVPDCQFGRQKSCDSAGKKLAAQMLSGLHGHRAIGGDDEGIERGDRITGAEAGQPVILPAECRVNLFNAGGRFGPDVE